jgi:hypothetical protein
MTSGTYPWSFVTKIFHSGQPRYGGDRKIFEVMTSTMKLYSLKQPTQIFFSYLSERILVQSLFEQSILTSRLYLMTSRSQRRYDATAGYITLYELFDN